MVVLAAGGSRRLGRAKQLEAFQGRPLVERAARAGLESGAEEVAVVVGAHSEEVRELLSGLPVTLLENSEWGTGMASSIRRGIEAIGPKVESAIIAAADQPWVTPQHLRRLIELLAESGLSIAASRYEGVLGVPCAFSRREFPRLMALSGDEGARQIVRAHPEAVAVAPFEAAGLDVDTPEDLRRLQGDSDA